MSGTPPTPSEIDAVLSGEVTWGGKAARTRSGHPNRSTDFAIRQWVIKMAETYPRTIGGTKDSFADPSIPASTFLARIIHALDYVPSSLSLLAQGRVLSRKGYIDDSDIKRMSMRELSVDHCSRPLLEELTQRIADNEVKLIHEAEKKEEVKVTEDLLADLAGETGMRGSSGKELVEVDDPILGKIKLDQYGEVVGVVAETEEAPVMSEAKPSEWGSW